nr:reverse transcriptase domain-containing protein [Tanacetum cinerariifolium]
MATTIDQQVALDEALVPSTQRLRIGYNCKGEGHMSKQCTKPRRKRDAEWFNQNQGQGNNFNRGNNFQPFQVPNQGFQNQPFQVPNNLVQQGFSNDFSNYKKVNDQMMRNMQNQINSLKGEFKNEIQNTMKTQQIVFMEQQNAFQNNLQNMLCGFFQNQSSTSGTLSSKTIPDPKGKMKAITTRSGVAYEGPSIPTPKKVVERETEETTDKVQSNFQGSTAHIQPLVTLIMEPGVPKTLPKPNIPYPSRLNDQKLLEKATNQLKKFFQIFQDLHFDISFADALLLMPKFASTIKSLLTNKDKEEYAQEILGFSNNSSGGNPTLTFEPILFDSSPSLTPFEGSDFILEEIDAYLKDESISLEIVHADYDPEGDICLIEKLLNDDPFQLSSIDLKQGEVSHIHYVPKKGGTTVVENGNNELIPIWLVTGWRVCIDYKKLNDATRKDHFPLPFMDQMLERLAGNEFYCFLDGFSGYIQIPINPPDQEKTTFTCPYGTFAYRRMPFGHCNAPGTFQRCMMTLKKKLTGAPILVVPDWNLPFELMCDASDFAIGAVLG